MRFPNAYAGVRKLFIAEILDIVASVLLLVAVLFGATLIAAGQNGASDEVVMGAAAGTIIFMAPGLIITLVAGIFTLIGLWDGGKDEPTYLRRAFWVSIASLVASGISGSMTSASGQQTMGASLVELVAYILDLVVINFTVEGIGTLCRRIRRPDILEFGRKLMLWLTIALGCSLIATIAANWIGVAASIVSSALHVAVYVGYIIFLSRAKKALAQEA